MTRIQGLSQGPSATASTSVTDGLEWPLRPQQEEPPAPDESLRTRHDWIKMFLWAQQEEPPAPDESLRTRHDWIKMFLWAQQDDKHSSPGCDVWTGSTGLGFAAAGGHESAAIRRA